MNNDLRQKFEQIEALIGGTPLLEISYSYRGKPGKIYAKAESYNLTGSIKDRVALHIMRRAYEKGAIRPGDVIAEATSGNTGISFAALGRYLGHKVVIYMPDWMSSERINIMRSYGAELRLVSAEEGGFLGAIAMTKQLADGGGVFLPGQFDNPENIDAHVLTTGEEIVRQLSALGLCADGIVAGVGTGGTVMGLGRRLRTENKFCKACPLEPLNSPTLSTGYKVGKHRIQGISDEFIPEIVNFAELDEIISVDDADSILTARMLSERFGLGVGISSGANFLGAVLLAEKLGSGSVVVTTFADDNKKYLSTDYSKPPAREEGEISREVELSGMAAHPCAL